MILISSKSNDSGIHSNVENYNEFMLMTLDVLDYFLSNNSRVKDVESIDESGFMVVLHNRRATVFYNDCKYVSVYFPFGYSIARNDFHYSAEAIDAMRVSHLRTILAKVKEKGSLIEGLDNCNNGIPPTEVEYVTDSDKELYTQLCTIEPGYLRFDYDEKNKNGRLHPLNHLDLNYSSDSTYKIGIYEHLSREGFLRFLNNDEERFYLESDKCWTRIKHICCF